MNSRKAGFLRTLALGLGILVGGTAFAEVVVFAEGAYTDTDLVVIVYADITGPAILSQGVTLMYSPSELEVVTATKNTDVWFMGDAPPGFAYMDPETSTPGEVVCIGGKLDTNDPLAGVVGERKELCRVRFNRLSSTDPGADPQSFFGMELTLGRPLLSYDNFVTTAGVRVDESVDFAAPTIRQRGDANADGAINAGDASEVRDMFFGGLPYVIYADCNDDGFINAGDASCVRDKFFGIQ